MDVTNGGDGGRTFRVIFSSGGVEMLRERVKEKLKEFMGDYTDDTLVEYVIVLLKNGRSKDEARSELNVFLDEDSDSFVSWLWDHLGSNISLYIQAQESHEDGPTKSNIGAVDQDGTNVSNNLESESEKMKPKSSRSRHNRLWKGAVRDAAEQPRLLSSVAGSTHAEKERHHKVSLEKRSISPQPLIHRKRKQPEEKPQSKREVTPQAPVDAPRRLLQFAVRDAVATSKPTILSTESSLKRLRSVVSAPAEDSYVEELPQRTQSIARVPVAMASAIKAVAEAAEDVKSVRTSGNVFDRLGRGTDVLRTSGQLRDLREESVDVGEGTTFDDRRGCLGLYDIRTDNARPYTGDLSVLQNMPRMDIDPQSDEENYGVRVRRQGIVDVSQAGTSGQYKVEDMLMNKDGVPYTSDEVIDKSKNWDQPVDMSNTSNKLANVSSNSNTWISPQYRETKENVGADSRKNAHVSEAMIATSAARVMETNTRAVSANGTAKVEVDLQKESKVAQLSAPGSHPTNRPVEDADARTIFVTNVHFAATKDSLLRHFNKFGEVLKVIILTDAATGQPKGSAYVEFMKREAADSALSLDGTSFMSRLLKVVRKNSAHQDASSIMALPRIPRGSPFPMSRYGRVAFPRGIPSVYRGRFLLKPGARSMQWKRDSQSTSGELPGPASSSSNPSTATRGLTYVRPESKINRSTSAT